MSYNQKLAVIMAVWLGLLVVLAVTAVLTMTPIAGAG